MATREDEAQVRPPDASREVSSAARAELVGELEDAVGKDAVREADVDVDQAIEGRPHPVRTAFSDSKLLILLMGATALTVGVIGALVVKSWWVMLAAILVHSLLTAIVVGASMKLFSQVEKPDPNTVTKLEDEGVDDPEGAVNELVGQVQESRERGS